MPATSHHMYFDDIRKAARKNDCFRRVVCTGTASQVVLMSLAPGEDVGEETHGGSDQIFVFVGGDAEAIVGARTRDVGKNDIIFVPAGVRHNIRNVATTALKMYAVHAPAVHAEGTIHRTREDAFGAVAQNSPVCW